uniref:Protoporphyrinogen oxidase n=1 Tax=Saccoglossus kowalevskii TaxID=10224 RepID=A0ABM0M2U4_SACKO|nr:PREDICTED: protoporphyrinogen oxidase-like [Saccoglossus kowalevskii]
MTALAVVLGGGISGLSSAYYLARSQALRFGKVVVVESSHRTGGWVNTTVSEDGAIFEHGPRSLRTAGAVGKNTLELMHQLPSGLKSVLFTQAPFTKPFISYIMKEPFVKTEIEEDESVHDFIRKRLGNEIADYVMDPLCIGIFAGDARKLSAKSCFPAIFDPARQRGSLIKGLFLQGKEAKSESNCALVKQAKKERWPVWTLQGGLQTLTDKLTDTLMTQHGVEIIKQNQCKQLEFTDNNTIKVTTKDNCYTADHVISAVPATVLSGLLPSNHNILSKLLQEIQQVSVAVINLEFEGNVLPTDGFGYLIPSWEKSKLLGVIYDSCTFPQHNRPGSPTTRLTCMMGGHWFEDNFGDPAIADPEHLLAVAMESLKEQINIEAKPTRSIVNIHKDAIPQYRVGHFKIVDKINKYLDHHNMPLDVIGSSFCGVSVNDCIYNGRRTAEKLLT